MQTWQERMVVVSVPLASLYYSHIRWLVCLFPARSFPPGFRNKSGINWRNAIHCLCRSGGWGAFTQRWHISYSLKKKNGSPGVPILKRTLIQTYKIIMTHHSAQLDCDTGRLHFLSKCTVCLCLYKFKFLFYNYEYYWLKQLDNEPIIHQALRSGWSVTSQ